MRIGLITTKGGFSGSSGSGIFRYAHELYKNLAALQSQNFELGKVEIELNSRIDKIRMLAFFYRTAFFNDSSYDITHLMEPGIIYSKLFKRAEIITTVHDLAGHFNKWEFNSAKALGFYYLLKAAERLSLNSDYIIADSSQTKTEIAAIGYPRKRVFVVPLGIDGRFYKERPGIKNRIFTVGSVGELSATGNRRISDIVSHIESRDITINLWGRPNSRAHLNDKRINVMGFAPEKQLIKTYDTFHVFVCTTLYSGFELAIFEAQARGIPVVIYKNSKIPKEVRRYCLEAGDEAGMAGIIEHIKNNGYDEKHRKKAMEYARSFTWENTARKTLDVYEKVV